MLLSEIREQVYDRAGISPDDPIAAAPTVDRFINAALRKASTTFDPFWLETSGTLSLSAGTNAYALSTLSNFHKLSRLEYTDIDKTLLAIGKHELTRHLSYSSQRPQFYTVEAQQVKFAPMPDQAYTLRAIYYRLEDPLVDESDSPLLPDQYSDWLVCEAAILAATKNRDLEMLTVMRQERDEWIRRIRDDIRQMRALPRVRIRQDVL